MQVQQTTFNPNRIKFAQRQHVKTVQEAWVDATTHSIPFTCEADLVDSVLEYRVKMALRRRYGIRRWSMVRSVEINRTSPTGGLIMIEETYSIGD